MDPEWCTFPVRNDFFLFFVLLQSTSHTCALLVFCITGNTVFLPPHTHSSLPCKSSPLFKTHFTRHEAILRPHKVRMFPHHWVLEPFGHLCHQILPAGLLLRHNSYFSPTAHLCFKSLRIRDCSPGLTHLWASGHNAQRELETQLGRAELAFCTEAEGNAIRCLNLFPHNPNALNVFFLFSISASILNFGPWKGWLSPLLGLAWWAQCAIENKPRWSLPWVRQRVVSRKQKVPTRYLSVGAKQFWHERLFLTEEREC